MRRAQSENWDKLYRQNEMPENAMLLVFNLRSSSQAGRRGFESSLPLYVFNNLQAPFRTELRLCSVNFNQSSKMSGTNQLRGADVLRFSLVTGRRRACLGGKHLNTPPGRMTASLALENSAMTIGDSSKPFGARDYGRLCTP
jgi:hypothetical protein